MSHVIPDWATHVGKLDSGYVGARMKPMLSTVYLRETEDRWYDEAPGKSGRWWPKKPNLIDLRRCHKCEYPNLLDPQPITPAMRREALVRERERLASDCQRAEAAVAVARGAHAAAVAALKKHDAQHGK